jgi:mRNA interferase MazF
MPYPQQGDIFWANLEPTRGKEQRGRRPVLVISRNELNKLPLTILVMIGTGAERISDRYASDLHVKAAEAGLPKDTTFTGLQIRSLDPARLGDRIGNLPPNRLPEIWELLRYIVGDDRPP